MTTILSPAGILADPNLTAYWRMLSASGDVPDANGVGLDLQVQGGHSYPLTYEEAGDGGGLAIMEHPPNTTPPNTTGGRLFGEALADYFQSENPSIAGVPFWSNYFSGGRPFTYLFRLKLDATAIGDFMPFVLFGSVANIDMFGVEPDTGKLIVVSHKAVRSVASEPSYAATVALDGHYSTAGDFTKDVFLWVAWAFSGSQSTIYVGDTPVLTFADSGSHTANPPGDVILGQTPWATNTQAQFFGADANRQSRVTIQDFAIFATDIVPQIVTYSPSAVFKRKLRIPKQSHHDRFDRAAQMRPLADTTLYTEGWEFAGNTTETDEPVPTTPGTIRRSVWFRYVAPANGTLVVTPSGSVDGSASIVLAAYTGSDLSSLSEVDSNNGPVTISVSEGTTYWFQCGTDNLLGNGEALLSYVHTSATTGGGGGGDDITYLRATVQFNAAYLTHGPLFHTEIMGPWIDADDYGQGVSLEWDAGASKYKWSLDFSDTFPAGTLMGSGISAGVDYDVELLVNRTTNETTFRVDGVELATVPVDPTTWTAEFDRVRFGGCLYGGNDNGTVTFASASAGTTDGGSDIVSADFSSGPVPPFDTEVDPDGILTVSGGNMVIALDGSNSATYVEAVI